ncbi:MAG: hypothetical protein M1812_005487 [Candelaria pacifica]|nr:MAG: hypothetical protein M1812_005487 [Candelaria pacifica]
MIALLRPVLGEDVGFELVIDNAGAVVVGVGVGVKVGDDRFVSSGVEDGAAVGEVVSVVEVGVALDGGVLSGVKAEVGVVVDGVLLGVEDGVACE